jgi:hypothetical protein
MSKKYVPKVRKTGGFQMLAINDKHEDHEAAIAPDHPPQPHRLDTNLSFVHQEVDHSLPHPYQAKPLLEPTKMLSLNHIPKIQVDHPQPPSGPSNSNYMKFLAQHQPSNPIKKKLKDLSFLPKIM